MKLIVLIFILFLNSEIYTTSKKVNTQANKCNTSAFNYIQDKLIENKLKTEINQRLLSASHDSNKDKNLDLKFNYITLQDFQIQQNQLQKERNEILKQQQKYKNSNYLK